MSVVNQRLIDFYESIGKDRKNIIVFLTTFILFIIISSKHYTWIFVSADSGDWLAASNWWFVPQPLGSPLYVSLGHFLNIFPGSLVLKMTILLSCLPSAITATIVYSITNKLIAPLLLLSSTIFFSQSVVLEEYAISTMFLVLSYYFITKSKYSIATIMLGLGTSIHIILLPITIILFIFNKDIRNIKNIFIFSIFGVGPYLLIPLLMYLETPPFFTGYFSVSMLFDYVTSTGGTIVGTLSINDFPLRLTSFLAFMMVNTGISLLLLNNIKTLKYSLVNMKDKYILLSPVIFIFWYYITNLDPSTWTFLTFIIPFIIIFIIKLSNDKIHNIQIVYGLSIILLLLNCIILNPNMYNYEGKETQRIFERLPKGTVVVTPAGAYSMCLFYTITEGRSDLVPLIWQEDLHKDYLEYLQKEHDITGYDIPSLVKNSIEKDRNTIILSNLKPKFTTNEWSEYINNLELEKTDSIYPFAVVNKIK